MKRNLMILVIGAALLAAMPASAANRTDSKQTINVKTGYRVTLNLRVSGGVGIDWRLVANSNRDVFRLIKVTTKPESADPLVVGGYSTKSYVFRARQAGVANVVFIRSYRGHDDKRHTVRVIVKAPTTATP